MTTTFQHTDAQPDFRRYREQWETAMLSLTMSECADAETRDQRDLYKAWFAGLFNGHSAHVFEAAEDGFRSLEWIQAGQTQFDLIYTAPYGARISLGRVYEQPNGSWAALTIAGVKDDKFEAFAAAEWAISRLSS